ncbi:MAG: CHRD domain-containing protein [Gemmatimonadota bacterium]
MGKHSRFLATLAMVGAFALAACAEGRDEGEMAEPIPDETGIPEPGLDDPGLTDTGVDAGPVEIGLEAKAESGITGTATVTPIADGIEVNLDLDGLTAGESYMAHLHRGACDNDMGVVAPLEDVSASGETGQSTTTIGTSMLDPTAESLFVQVHSADGTPIACGNVPEDAGLIELGAAVGEPGAMEPGKTTDEYR